MATVARGNGGPVAFDHVQGAGVAGVAVAASFRHASGGFGTFDEVKTYGGDEAVRTGYDSTLSGPLTTALWVFGPRAAGTHEVDLGPETWMGPWVAVACDLDEVGTVGLGSIGWGDDAAPTVTTDEPLPVGQTILLALGVPNQAAATAEAPTVELGTAATEEAASADGCRVALASLGGDGEVATAAWSLPDAAEWVIVYHTLDATDDTAEPVGGSCGPGLSLTVGLGI